MAKVWQLLSLLLMICSFNVRHPPPCIASNLYLHQKLREKKLFFSLPVRHSTSKLQVLTHFPHARFIFPCFTMLRLFSITYIYMHTYNLFLQLSQGKELKINKTYQLFGPQNQSLSLRDIFFVKLHTTEQPTNQQKPFAWSESQDRTIDRSIDRLFSFIEVSFAKGPFDHWILLVHFSGHKQFPPPHQHQDCQKKA